MADALRRPDIAVLLGAARSDSWEQRYRALERSRSLAVGLRREVASAFLADSNSWVRNLAERIVRSGQRPARRSRRGIVMEIDNVLKGAKLSSPQRSRLIELYEEAEQLGAFGYLALAMDRAARLVTETAAPSGSSDPPIRTLQTFFRHIANYTKPPELDTKTVRIGEVVAEPQWPITVEFDGSTDVRVNAAALRVIVEELSANAFEANAKRLRIVATSQVESVDLLIGDDGSGIDEDSEPHVFEPWFTTRVGHAGLGLTLAQAAAEAVGGAGYLTSAHPAGFSFSLPTK